MDSDAAGDFSRSGVTFRRHEKKSDDKESVWYYFLCEMPTKQSAKCTVSSCSKIIKTVGGSTKGLHTHLKSVHKIDLLAKKTNTSEVACSSTQQKEPARKGSLKTREDERNSQLDSFTYYLPTSGTGNPGIRGSPNPGTNPGIGVSQSRNPGIGKWSRDCNP